MTEESARRLPTQARSIRVGGLPFGDVPGQSRLFLEFQKDARSLTAFYPNAVAEPSELSDFAGEVLGKYDVDRGLVCDALLEINTQVRAGRAALAAIERLRDPATVAVLTGQQAGLFSGPLYTIYKALSAVKLAAELTAAGTPAVALFWAATDDHDLDEVRHVEAIAADGSLARVEYSPASRIDGAPVGTVEIDAGVHDAIDKLFAELPVTEFSPTLAASLREAWKPGETFGSAFLNQLAGALEPFGLIFVDPRNQALKRLAGPLIQRAIEQADVISSALLARNAELEAAGFARQVLVEDDHFPLFWQTDSGERSAVRRTGEGTFRSKADRREFTADELIQAAAAEPERLSPGVMLRPVVQDHLFPTVCYIGGGAEIAYFAQNSVVYEALSRPVTPIMHRQSFTVVEAKHSRTLEKFGIDLPDVFEGMDRLIAVAAEGAAADGAAKLFGEVEDAVNEQLHRLDTYFADTDPSLCANAAKRRRKMLYHVAALRKKAYASEVRRHNDTERRLVTLAAALYPAGALQERSVNLLTFTNRYGPGFIDWIYDSIDLSDRGHRILYL